MADPDALVARAREARERAYAPYSRFPVGAAIEADDGSIHIGCNVENGSYPLGMCAERGAVAAAVAAGRTKFRTLALSFAGEPMPPCGGCRQVLAEFGGTLRVIAEGGGGARVEWSLEDLLPEPFLLQGRERR